MNHEDNYRLTEKELARLRDWFHGYVRPFTAGDAAARKVLTLKEEHTLRVCREIGAIGRGLNLHEDRLRIAEAAALFHDIGRFEQYARYGTFVDGKSEDHARLGVQVLMEEGALAALNTETRELILRAISCHNRLQVPDHEGPVAALFCRLLRDADKLDILALFAAYYHGDEAERSAAVELDLPDSAGVSEDVLACIDLGSMVEMRQLKRLNDFKLLQLAWVYDINFPPTFRMIRERGYLGKIREALPVSSAIDRIYSRLLAHLEVRASLYQGR